MGVGGISVMSMLSERRACEVESGLALHHQQFNRLSQARKATYCLYTLLAAENRIAECDGAALQAAGRSALTKEDMVKVLFV